MQNVIERIDGAEAWMVAYIADLLDIPPGKVDADKAFDHFGLDSTATVAFTSDLGRWLGIKLDSRIMIENDSIRAVSQHLRGLQGKAALA